MSKEIDERVVRMQFENGQFESGVKTSMSTIERLKSALKFDSEAKGLDNISKAAKSVDMSKLGSGVESVKLKFSRCCWRYGADKDSKRCNLYWFIHDQSSNS